MTMVGERKLDILHDKPIDQHGVIVLDRDRELTTCSRIHSIVSHTRQSVMWSQPPSR